MSILLNSIAIYFRYRPNNQHSQVLYKHLKEVLIFYDIIVYLWLKFNTEFWKTFKGDPVAWLIFIENASWDKIHEVSFTSVFLF